MLRLALQTHHSGSQKPPVSHRQAEKPGNPHFTFFQSSEASVILALPHGWHMTTNQILGYFIYNRNILDCNLSREVTQQRLVSDIFRNDIWTFCYSMCVRMQRNAHWSHNMKEVIQSLSMWISLTSILKWMKGEIFTFSPNSEFRKVPHS